MKVLALRTGLLRVSPRRLALVAVAAGLLGGVALGPVPALAQETTAQLLQRMGRLERDLNTLQRQVYRGEGGNASAAASLSGQSSQPSGQGAVQPLPGDVAGRLQVRIGELERLVQDLTGRVEETQFQTRRVSQRLDQLVSDIDFRLGRIEQAAGLSASAAPMAGAEGSSMSAGEMADDGRLGSNFGEVASSARQRTPLIGSEMTGSPASGEAAVVGGEVGMGPSEGGTMAPEGGRSGVLGYMRSDGRALPAPAGSSGPSGESANPPTRDGGAAVADGALPDGTPEEQYRYAFSLLRKGDFAAAEQALKTFLKEHPDHALAGNAQYWLGESYYVRGDMQQAMVAFMDGYKTYPKSGKGPDNLLKLGMAAGALGQTEEACAVLEKLGQEYPQASDAIKRRAAAERQKLSCGG